MGFFLILNQISFSEGLLSRNMIKNSLNGIHYNLNVFYKKQNQSLKVNVKVVPTFTSLTTDILPPKLSMWL